MKGRTILSLLGVAAAGSQAGHLLAYALRFGAAAQQVQSAGAHTYFPSLTKATLGLVAIVAVAALLVVGLARVVGQRPERDSAPPYVRLLAVLFTVQLAAFAIQETAESVVSGASISVPLILVWGTVGQLPVAAAGALALHWLWARLRPAVAQLALLFEPAFRLVANTISLVAFPAVTEMVPPAAPAPRSFNRRGPPSF